MRAEIAVLRDGIAERFDVVDRRFKQTEHRLIAQLGLMLAGAVALLGTLMVVLKG
jgi:hypothetical protein